MFCGYVSLKTRAPNTAPSVFQDDATLYIAVYIDELEDSDQLNLTVKTTFRINRAVAGSMLSV